MPDLSPSEAMLRRLGLAAPPVSTPVPQDRQIKYDTDVRNQQANDPWWMKAGRAGLDVGVGATKGFLGVDPEKSDRENNPVNYWANAGSQILDAGLPFSGYAKKGLTKV